ncbi:squalene/phytoene synthase family protein [Pseudogemmobacter sp. W21_MBD1_M6]|uniref:squalene/phytoene synthase family protein n=1 Tax=Pseudogemmobacter sp. W21_MBD1_M6 TaxID=3240271 RepID=UPI003F9E6841
MPRRMGQGAMDLDACAALVERADPDRFLSAMASRPAARAVLFPLYAFNIEVARAPWVTAEPMIAEMRLQWWRDALDEIGTGKTPRKHEVVTPLADILDEEACGVLDGLVAARRWDIYKDPFEGAAHFDAYINATSGGLMWTAARLLGARDPAPVRDLAYAAGVANWLRAIPELEARGRFALVDGSPEAIRDLAEDALARLDRARKARGAVPLLATPALLAGWRAAATLKAARDVPWRVGEGKLGESEFRRKAALLVRSMTGRW